MTKTIHLYTDGSSINNEGKDKGLGGYGFVLLYGDFSNLTEDDLKTQYCDEKFMLTGFDGFTNTTNQKMEIKSVIEGLKAIKNKSIKIDVFADSAYVVNCMNKRWFDNWRTNGWKNSKKQPVESRELWEELLTVIEDNFLDITFNKVKGHSTFYYNNMADRLANQGLNKARGY